MDAFIRKDIERFGRLIDVAWQLNKRLDPNSSNDEIEALFARVGPHIHGGKLLGAGGGGFMLMVCKSPRGCGGRASGCSNASRRTTAPASSISTSATMDWS